MSDSKTPSPTQVINDLSDLLSRTNLARSFEQFAGERNLYDVFGWTKHPEAEQLHDWYLRDALAGAIIEIPVEDTWKEPPSVMLKDEEEGPNEFRRQLDRIKEKFGLWNLMKRADRLSRIGEYGVILLGLSDVASDSDFERPPEELDSPEDVKYLTCYPQKHVDVEEWNLDPSSPRFGMPEFYSITQTTPDSDTDVADETDTSKIHTIEKVHWKRVIHIAENTDSNEAKGRPVLLRVFNRLEDLIKVVGSSAETYYQIASPRYHLDMDPEYDVSDKAADALSDDWDEFIMDIKKYFRSQGMDVEVLGGEDVRPQQVFDVLLSYLSSSPGIPPKRILMGNETGERASSEDRKMWLGRVSGRQTSYVEPVIIRQTIDRFQEFGILPQADYKVKFPPLFEMSEEQKAEIARAKAQAYKAVADAQLTNPLLTEKEARQEILDLEPETPEELQDFDLAEEERQEANIRNKFLDGEEQS